MQSDSLGAPLPALAFPKEKKALALGLDKPPKFKSHFASGAFPASVLVLSRHLCSIEVAVGDLDRDGNTGFVSKKWGSIGFS